MPDSEIKSKLRRSNTTNLSKKSVKFQLDQPTQDGKVSQNQQSYLSQEITLPPVTVKRHTTTDLLTLDKVVEPMYMSSIDSVEHADSSRDLEEIQKKMD